MGKLMGKPMKLAQYVQGTSKLRNESGVNSEARKEERTSGQAFQVREANTNRDVVCTTLQLKCGERRKARGKERLWKECIQATKRVQVVILAWKGSCLEGTQIKFSMDQTSQWWSKETVAVVTGSNRGIGHELVRQLASKGITVLSTARDGTRGRAAVEGFHSKGLKNVDFHPLDIGDSESVTRFAKWLESKYGGLDILINNAAVGAFHFEKELAIRDIKNNYYGTKNVTETLLPLMKHSDAGARVVSLSSLHGELVHLKDTAARELLSGGPDNYTEATIDEIAERYLAAVEAGQEEAEKWGISYAVSKVLICAYTRALARRMASRPEGEKIYVNCTDPGVVMTDAYDPAYGPGIPVDQGAGTTVWVALLPKGGPSGKFFHERKEKSW